MGKILQFLWVKNLQFDFDFWRGSLFVRWREKIKKRKGEEGRGRGEARRERKLKIA
jgi:hypothetical protein